MKRKMIEAFELKNKGCYKQAIEIYYKLLSTVGDNIEILNELSELYLLLGNKERATHYVGKALEIDSNNTSSLKVLKEIYIFENNFKDAESIAEQIYKLSPSTISLYDLLLLLKKQKKNDSIIRLTNNLVDEDCLLLRFEAMFNIKKYVEAKNEISNNKHLFNNLKIAVIYAKICYKIGDRTEAREVFRTLNNNDIQDAETLNYIGLTYLDELKIDESIEYFNKTIELEQKNSKYFYNLGQAYFLKGWFQEAEKYFNNAICLNPLEEEYHYSLAYLYYKLGAYEKAKLHLNKEFLSSNVLLQVIDAEAGNLASAKSELEKLLSLNEQNEFILFSLSKIYFKLDMFKRSLSTLEKLLDIKPESFEYNEFYIRLLLKLDNKELAKSKIDELLKKYPNYFYAKVLEAEYYFISSDFDSLYDSAQDLIDLDCNHFEGYYYNALSLFEKYDVNFAIESLKKAISLNVNDADLYVKMAEFYQKIGRDEDAFEYIKEASDIDKSAKNKELYIKMASVLRKKNL